MLPGFGSTENERYGRLKCKYEKEVGKNTH